MTPEQRDRLDRLREKRERGERPKTEDVNPPVHMNHAHCGGTDGMAPCACPPACPWCAL